MNVRGRWFVIFDTLNFSLIMFQILRSCDPKDLHLCPNDNLIYEDFRHYFKDFDVEVIEEADMKTEKWREFSLLFEGVIDDYNFGTLLRADCHGDYTSENTFIVFRIQFLAIETARNREGLNSGVRHLKSD
ncbi:unnamed protein product [Soboliphyme baturini]|uniref:Polysacc_synt_4 domain-containing protein n=1 Tax=Soboliphyme baturini TaxID=241478 RepID=A0A183IDN5_9BILA|nr:unnamed protein product [Soboliphyme baturini]